MKVGSISLRDIAAMLGVGYSPHHHLICAQLLTGTASKAGINPSEKRLVHKASFRQPKFIGFFAPDSAMAEWPNAYMI
jgi:hypothetical protein